MIQDTKTSFKEKKKKGMQHDAKSWRRFLEGCSGSGRGKISTSIKKKIAVCHEMASYLMKSDDIRCDLSICLSSLPH